MGNHIYLIYLICHGQSRTIDIRSSCILRTSLSLVASAVAPAAYHCHDACWNRAVGASVNHHRYMSIRFGTMSLIASPKLPFVRLSLAILATFAIGLGPGRIHCYQRRIEGIDPGVISTVGISCAHHPYLKIQN